jgi:hypothetical protein
MSTAADVKTTGSPRWTNARLDALRQVGDDLIDPLVRELYEAEGPAALGRLTRQLDDWEAPIPEDLTPGLRDYFAERVAFPAWVDESRVRHAEDMFTSFGPLTLSSLLLNSYPHFLTCPAGAYAMYRARAFSPESVASRMLELAQFSVFMGERYGLSNGNRPDGTHQPGRSFVAYRKLRVIHGNLRLLLAGPHVSTPWDASTLGVVVNQEDLALAVTCFCVSTLDGLRKSGFDLSETDQEATLMAWRIAGWLLGLADELQPNDIQEATRLRDAILARHQRATPEASVVVREMLHVVEGLLPPGVRRVPAALVRFQVGPRTADLLDLPNRRLLVGLLHVTQPFWKTTRLFAGLSKLVSPPLLRWATAPNRLGGNRRLTLPPKLAARIGSDRQ